MSSVEEKVKKIIADVFNVKPEDLKDETSFVADLRAKSADVVELIALLEEEFKIEIPLSEALKNRTVGDACRYIERKISGG